MGDLPEGAFDVFGDVLRVVSTPEWTAERLQTLADSLAVAERQRASPETVVEIVHDQAPDLESIFRRLLVPKDAGQFYGMLAIIVMILLALISNGGEGGGVSERDVDHMVDQAIERTIRAQPQPPPLTALPSQPPRLPTQGRRRKRPERAPKTFGKHKRRKRH